MLLIIRQKYVKLWPSFTVQWINSKFLFQCKIFFSPWDNDLVMWMFVVNAISICRITPKRMASCHLLAWKLCHSLLLRKWHSLMGWVPSTTWYFHIGPRKGDQENQGAHPLYLQFYRPTSPLDTYWSIASDPGSVSNDPKPLWVVTSAVTQRQKWFFLPVLHPSH